MSEKKLLVEAGDFINCFEVSHDLKESLRLSAGKGGILVVKNIPCTVLDRKNQNGRIYPTDIMRKAIAEAASKFKTKQCLSQCKDHPESSFCIPSDVSHAVVNAYIKNVEIEIEGKRERYNVLYEDWEVLDDKSEQGAQLQSLILAGFGAGISIRGLGSCDNSGVVTEYEFLGTDVVGLPSSGTFLSTPVNESVEITSKPLTETFVVSSSATNVVRNIDDALMLSKNIDDAQFGSVVKTSTKLDSEVDPKTGAETTMVTLETETEDEVSELDQALGMAKRAILNGKADIDSVTIEVVKEEQPKESVENDTDDVLNEDDKNLGLKKIVDIKGVEITGPDEKELWRVSAELRNSDDHNAMEWQRSYKSLVDAGVDQTYLNYANGQDMNEDYIPESEMNDSIGTISGEYRANHVGSPEKVAENMAQRQYNFIISNLPESDILRQQAENIFAKFERGENSALDTKIALGDIAAEVQKKLWGESVSMKEATDIRTQRCAKVYDYLDNMINNNKLSGQEREDAQEMMDAYVTAVLDPRKTDESLDAMLDKLEAYINGNNMSESKDTEYDVHEFTPQSVDWIHDAVISLMWNEGLTLEQACRKFCEQNENIPYEYLLEYMRTAPVEESVMTEATKEEDPKEGKQFVLRVKEDTETDENSKPKFVAMNGNAIDFVEDPKDAIHFVKGKEESGVVHLSGIEKILETMGILKTEKYYKKDNDDISAPDDVNIQAAENAGIKVENSDVAAPMTEENGSNTRYEAIVEIDGKNGHSSETVPVSAVETDSILNEIANLWDMKSKQDSVAQVMIKLRDTSTGEESIYDPASRSFKTNGMQQPVKMEAAGDLEQDGNKLSMEVDDNNKVEKEFDTPEQAAVAKAGIEQGKFGGDVLLSEDGNRYNDPMRYMSCIHDFLINGGHISSEDMDNIWSIFSDWRDEKLSTQDACDQLEVFRKEIIKNTPNIMYDGDPIEEANDKADWKIAVLFNNLDFGDEEGIYNNADPTSGQSIFSYGKPKFIRVFLYPEELGVDDPESLIITPKGNKLINDKATQKLEDRIGIFGDVYSVRVWKRDETSKDMEDKDFERDVYELDEGTEEWDHHYSGIDQGNWENEDNPSLSYDLENSAICAWCGDRLPKSEMRHESKLGWLCNHCARGIQSREGRLEFDEEAPHYEDIEPGWYAGAMGIGITGPFESEEELNKELADVRDQISVEYISQEDIDGIKNESNNMSEIMYNKPGEASDPFIDKPLNEEKGKYHITLTNIDWDSDKYIDDMTSNMKADDPVDLADFLSKVNDLPDSIDFVMDAEELPEDNIDRRDAILAKASQMYIMPILDASIMMAKEV